MNPSENFVVELVHQFPMFKALYQAHVSYYKELLPHVFMGEVSGMLVSRFEKKRPLPDLPAFLAMLEKAWDEDQECVQELIAVSFLENIVYQDDFLDHCRPFFGPSLQTALKQFLPG